MFIISLTYKKPLDVVDQHLVAHREYLNQCYAQNLLLASGPCVPRTGGILIALCKTREQVQQLIAQDPFFIHEIADFQMIEFTPVKYHTSLEKLLN